MRMCETCCKRLGPHEVVTCDPCAADRIRSLLASRAWMEVRGCVEVSPGVTLADQMRSDLDFLSLLP